MLYTQNDMPCVLTRLNQHIEHILGNINTWNLYSHKIIRGVRWCWIIGINNDFPYKNESYSQTPNISRTLVGNKLLFTEM